MMEWNSNLSVNHVGIDNQHKKLIDIINKVSAAIVENEYHFEKVIDVVTDLNDYIEQHFKYEEVLMKKYGFPDGDEHLLEHDKVRSKLKEVDIFDVRNHEEFFSGLLIYLVEWLTDHIMKIDKNLGIHISMEEAGRE